MPWLINAAQVDKFRKSQKSLIILDASWHMPTDNRNAIKEFEEKHIIGAQFFDINAFIDPQSELPNTLLQDEKIISEKLGQIGIRNDYKIIFYDNSKLHTSCRALWMMKIFGHNPHQLYILDGGLAAWEKYIGKIEQGQSSITPKKYSAKLQYVPLRTLAHMKENLLSQKNQVVDLRHPIRFAGGPEIRPGIRPGHIPNSISFPFSEFFDKEGFFKPLDKLRKQLISVAIDAKTPIISTCGSGITAPILDFVLDLIGNTQHGVYAGSWTEWGAEKLYPNEKSLDERPVITSIEHDEPGPIP